MPVLSKMPVRPSASLTCTGVELGARVSLNEGARKRGDGWLLDQLTYVLALLSALVPGGIWSEIFVE